MIHISETLALQTVESFLTPEELTHLRKIMDDELETTGWQPRVQADVLSAPGPAQDILQQAVHRALAAIQRSMPSIRSAAPWGYTELGPRQRVPAHIDGIPDPGGSPRRLGRIGVLLTAPETGGEFYVETTAAPTVWSGTEVGHTEGYHHRTPLTHSQPHAPATGAHHKEPEWLAAAPRTRWVTHAGPGTATAYGAQVIHGVQPVRAGRLRKFVTDLLDR
ncbi:hypothetical protein [Streptomyces sp. NPDC101150]|uniref:hypothetical protein n=1 Tax=Streptomyces sp. NPDC101150 TaxID=3366114 RepID=UPI0037FCB77F